MRATLRRSCDACARAKHACDRRTPQCTRCAKRKATCTYANEPLTSSSDDNHGASQSPASRNHGSIVARDAQKSLPSSREGSISPGQFDGAVKLSLTAIDASVDPFDSYPTTRLPRRHVQRLIHHFLSDIAFQYYPLDLSAQSNPFVTAWWPQALADPALFHVSLQTASLDEELHARKGFAMSEQLMMDSVSLLRRNVGDSSRAVQDATLNSVVTLAAIEFGKGNILSSKMHINGVVKMVRIRGGIRELKRASPLTARMVSWVSLLVMNTPQFPAQDDTGSGDGVGPIPQWQLASAERSGEHILRGIPVDPAIDDVFFRIRDILCHPTWSLLTGTELHDLTCFVLHKLLQTPPFICEDAQKYAISEGLRYATALFMLIIHGHTYYTHDGLASILVMRLRAHLEPIEGSETTYSALGFWLFYVGMTSASDRDDAQWFAEKTSTIALALGILSWEDAAVHLEKGLWVKGKQADTFHRKWGAVARNTSTSLLPLRPHPLVNPQDTGSSSGGSN